MTTMDGQIKLVSVTPDAEKTIAYVARVSNPANQDNEKFAGLLRYCIQHGHWSVFEQAFMTVEIIPPEDLLHRYYGTVPSPIRSSLKGIRMSLILERIYLCLNFVARMKRIGRIVLMM